MSSTLLPPPAQSAPADKRSSLPGRLFGLAMIAIGVAGWWYNWHLASTAGHFYIKLCILGPLGIFGGLLVAARPDWAGPWRSDAAPARKISTIAVLALVAVASGIDFYLLKRGPAPRNQRSGVIAWTPEMGKPKVSIHRPMMFMTKLYRLGSFNQRQHATWEFVTAAETVNNWSTLLTVIDRPDARTREELDRLAEGIMTQYKSYGGQILAAKTLRDDSGGPFNYMVVAFEESGSQRFELNFVKLTLGPKNAAAMIYGVRISDPRDYLRKAKEYLDQHSAEVGRALAAAPLPDIDALPRRTF